MQALIAAYREGLAPTAVTVVTTPGGIRVRALAQDEELRSGENAVRRWWCYRSAEAECVAESAMRSLRRQRSQSGDESARACDLVIRTADRLGVSLLTNADIEQEALRALARLDEEIARQQRAGGMKSVNQSYRQYRLETTGRGERVLPYAKWMGLYKVKLVREIAANLRRL